ncbi:UNVERIFIED_CONTAM: hypothetical protein GTU68_000353 [Idotea baltica]|nr:hypothetical protein [Idotea baltica]
MRANNIRKGTVVIYNKAPCKVMGFTHVTPGKGQAVVQVKLRNMLTGSQTETRYGATENVDIADVYTSKATFLYKSQEDFVFMDSQSYEQFELSNDVLGNDAFYMQEQLEVTVTRYNEEPIGVELPSTVILEIVETEPELKGATASNSPKPAITDTGLQLSVPAFVKEGEKISVNTQTGEYLSRAD